MRIPAFRSARMRWAAAGVALLALTAVVVVATVAGLLSRVPGRVAALLLAAVLGGALGNLADRLFRAPGLGGGAVIDWIHVQGYPATFNIADVAIRAGAVVAVVTMPGTRRRPGRRSEIPAR